MKKIPINIEDFKEVIDKDYYYIDKSMFIKEAIDEKFIIYNRPEKFGKTLNMNMLYYFLSNKEKDNAYLFDNLEISNYPEIMKYQNQYPVIFITLKDMTNSTYEKQIEKYREIIQKMIKQHSELFESKHLSEYDKEELIKYKNGNFSEIELEDTLKSMTYYLNKHYQKDVYVLIDAYDIPLYYAYHHDYYQEMASFISGALSMVMKTNNNLKTGILTGYLWPPKASIFSGLNNYNLYSIMNYRSSQSFGFTKKEIEQLLKDYNLEKYSDEIKLWYGGYLFGKTDIYNPYSVVNYIHKLTQNKTDPEIFWESTLNNHLIIECIDNDDYLLHKEFDTLMAGNSITKNLNLVLSHNEIDKSDNIYGFLLLAGYLKAVKEVDYETYELVIPNQEIHEIYKKVYLTYFKEFINQRKTNLYQALNNGETNSVIDLLNDILDKTISYYNTQPDFYYNLLINLLSNLEIESNKETKNNSFNIKISPKRTTDSVIIIKGKYSNTLRTLRHDSQEGAKQIIDKGYGHVIGYGISFNKKQCYITKA